MSKKTSKQQQPSRLPLVKVPLSTLDKMLEPTPKKKRCNRAKHVPPILRHNLTAWMNSNNYTNLDLAANIGDGGVSLQSISRWLTGKPINGSNLLELRLFCRDHDIPAGKPIKFDSSGKVDKYSCPCADACMCDTNDDCLCSPKCTCDDIDISDDGDGPDTDAPQPSRYNDDCGCYPECIGPCRCSADGSQSPRAGKLAELLTAGRLLQEAEERFRKARLAYDRD